MKQLLPLRYLIIPIFVSVSFTFLAALTIFISAVGRDEIYFALGWGAALAFFIGFPFGVFVLAPFLAKIARGETEMYTAYESTVQTIKSKPDEPPVILLEDKVKGITYRISRLDTTLDMWIALTQEFIKSGYAYNQNIFESVFGREQEIGREKYRLFSAQFLTIGMVEEYRNGFRFTQFGIEKIDQLSKGDWRVLEEIPEGITNV